MVGQLGIALPSRPGYDSTGEGLGIVASAEGGENRSLGKENPERERT